MAQRINMVGKYPTMPNGTEVAAYRSYDEAVDAVERLSAADFPLNTVTIVGSDLHMVETVLGKLTPGKIALGGATQGLTWGLLMGLFSILLFKDSSPLIPIFAILIGVLGGILLSVLGWSTTRNRRDFAARSQMVATRYALLVSEQTDKAFQLLQGTTGNLAQRPKTRVRRHHEGPTEFGSKPDEQPRFGVRLSETKQPKENSSAEAAPSSSEPDLSQD